MKARLKNSEIDCVFWDGVHREPVYEALESILRAEAGPNNAGHWREFLTFSADEESGEKWDDYNMVKLWGCGGPEVDPGNWLTWTWYAKGGFWTWGVLSDGSFRDEYEVDES